MHGQLEKLEVIDDMNTNVCNYETKLLCSIDRIPELKIKRNSR